MAEQMANKLMVFFEIRFVLPPNDEPLLDDQGRRTIRSTQGADSISDTDSLDYQKQCIKPSAGR